MAFFFFFGLCSSGCSLPLISLNLEGFLLLVLGPALLAVFSNVQIHPSILLVLVVRNVPCQFFVPLFV